jgi:hypothetical protein
MMIPMASHVRHHCGRDLRYSLLTSYRCVRGRDRDRTAPLHLRAITWFSIQLQEKALWYVMICTSSYHDAFRSYGHGHDHVRHESELGGMHLIVHIIREVVTARKNISTNIVV